MSILLFCYLLIHELKSLSNPAELRPTDYYKYHIYTILIILNVISIVFRITAGFGIFLYLNVVKLLTKRKQLEKQERLIFDENLEIKKHNNIILDTGNYKKKFNDDLNLNSDNIKNKKLRNNEKIIIDKEIKNDNTNTDIENINNDEYFNNNHENSRKLVIFIYN